MAGGVIEGHNVACHWRYLGAEAVSPRPLGAGPRGWPLPALASVQALSWAPALKKCSARAKAVAALRGSFGIRASEWNVYVTPLVVYPARIAHPPFGGPGPPGPRHGLRFPH